MFRFTRTFHPVGQGAFYSEEIHLSNGGIFRMVYDCGSVSLSQSDLKNRIKSDLAGDITIDILFISHFDKDHTNGVCNLEPKTIVIPFLSKNQILLLKLYNKIFGETYNVLLAEDPARIFPNTRIIRVLPEDPEPNLSEVDINNGFTIDINNGFDRSQRNNITIKSLSPIKLTDRKSIINDNPFWVYIPFNPNWDKYASDFQTAIKKEGLDWNDLTDLSNDDYLKKYFSALKKIYNQLKPKNEHSLVVYSNATTNKCITYHWFNNAVPLYFRHFYFHEYDTPSGCIYFGDATIETKWINSFYRHLKKINHLHKVGTLQVPHHGSYLSNGQDIMPPRCFFRQPVVCIISVGEVNHFGHPSAYVVQELQSRGGIAVMVTENSSSLFYSEGRV